MLLRYLKKELGYTEKHNEEILIVTFDDLLNELCQQYGFNELDVAHKRMVIDKIKTRLPIEYDILSYRYNSYTSVIEEARASFKLLQDAEKSADSGNEEDKN